MCACVGGRSSLCVMTFLLVRTMWLHISTRLQGPIAGVKMRRLKCFNLRSDCDTLQAHLATLPAMCAHVRPLLHTLLTTRLSYTPSGHRVRRSPSPFPSPLVSFSQAPRSSARVHPATDLGHLSAAVAARPHRPSPPTTLAAAQHCLV